MQIRPTLFAMLMVVTTGAFATSLLIVARGAPVEAGQAPGQRTASKFDDDVNAHAERLREEGRQIFRLDTFGSEAFWGAGWGCTGRLPVCGLEASAPV